MNHATQISAPSFHVGTMGWGYADWLGVFYPEKAHARDYIRYYAQAFDMVEIDSTFYGTPRETQVRQWKQMTPEGFTFCPKVPRLITHDLQLQDAMEPLAGFVRTMGLLGAKRGPMLLQLGPDFTRAQIDTLVTFLPALQTLSAQKEMLAEGNPPRFAIEFRHRSLLGTDVSQMLADHGVALTLADFDYMPRRFELTTDFLYLRLIGKHGDYPRHDRPYGDRTADMQRWADWILANQANLTSAYIQCNNDYEGYSPATADKMRQMLGMAVRTKPVDIQGSLF